MPIIVGHYSGVYCWVNKVNGKRYVGSAQDVQRRRAEYLNAFAKGKCHNKHFLFAWQKYGKESFIFVVLEKCPEESLAERETRWIAHFDSTDPEKGYNICKIGYSKIGVPHTDEARGKMSKTKKEKYQTEPGPRTGAVLSEETKKRISDAKKGKKMPADCPSRNKSPEWLAGIAAGNRGKKASDQTRKKMSDTRKGRENGPHSDKTKKKISETKLRQAEEKRIANRVLPSDIIPLPPPRPGQDEEE
jgi:group I intron endonuclease